MKRIYLVRHAKSDWGSEWLKDIDRPLNERGYRDAYFMSEWFVGQKHSASLIISSTASRALNTALIFARAMGSEVKNLILNEHIYQCHERTLFEVLREQKDNIQSLMVFCHNPCITEAVNLLNSDVYVDNVPTCGIVNINFDVNLWADMEEKKGTLGFFRFPKDFRNIH